MRSINKKFSKLGDIFIAATLIKILQGRELQILNSSSLSIITI